MHQRRAHESPADRSADDHAGCSGEPEPAGDDARGDRSADARATTRAATLSTVR